MKDEHAILEGWDGTARLFPLPNLVFFPQVVQPLHIFEPRYRQMTADALAGDRLIALVLPRPGWEKEYEGRPTVHDVACLGRIIADQQLDDGRYNLLLRGVSRIRIGEELAGDTLYRRARVALMSDITMSNAARAEEHRGRLVTLAPTLFPHAGPVQREFAKLLQGDIPLGALSDIVAFALPLDVSFKQSLLEELDVDERVQRLIAYLQALRDAGGKVGDQRAFPPEFSAN